MLEGQSAHPGGHCRMGAQEPRGLSGFYSRATSRGMQNQICTSERSMSRTTRNKGEAGHREAGNVPRPTSLKQTLSSSSSNLGP